MHISKAHTGSMILVASMSRKSKSVYDPIVSVLPEVRLREHSVLNKVHEPSTAKQALVRDILKRS